MTTLKPSGSKPPLVKRLLLGRPIATDQAQHHLLGRLLALPVFASDALSSNAYATEEMLHVLILAGVAATSLALPIAGAVAALLVIVIISYRQTVIAYPSNGGAYSVSRDNLGPGAGLVAAAALLIDYVLTVSVSIAAGSFAISSLVPSLSDKRVPMALVFVAVIALMNLRGLREAGTFFAIPTYAFVLSVLVMIGVGLTRCAVSGCPTAPHAEAHEAVTSVGFFLILRAFSSGATALTGVEAIANGVGAFKGRRPSQQARNAAATLAILGVLTVTIFLGLTILANRVGALPSEERSVVAQIALAVFGDGIGFAVIQITTAMILILAANTAFQDFPRLGSILARDRYLPRQFLNLGDRLVFSNGIVMLGLLAATLLVLFDADVTKLIQLYVVGVFTSFTLSQAGMVVRQRRLREHRWHRRALISGIGATTTGTVLVVVAATKFRHGAWIVIVAIPILIALFTAINRHYRAVAMALRDPANHPAPITAARTLVLAPRLDAATLTAVGYARAIRAREVRALHVAEAGGEAFESVWREAVPQVPLTVVPANGRGVGAAVRVAVASMRPTATEPVTVVVPETLGRRGVRGILRKRGSLLLKASLLFQQNVHVTDVPVPAGDAPGASALQPARVAAIVLVSGVHNATKHALAYARTISPTEVRAVTIDVDPRESERVMREWFELDSDVRLEVIGSPFRETAGPLLTLIRGIRAQRPGTIVSVILPEFIVRRWWHQALHNQTALSLKAALLFEPGVIVTSVPFHLP